MVSVFFSLSGYRYLGDGGINRREILHDGTCRCRTESLPCWDGALQGIPKIPNFGPKFWPFIHEYFENGKSQRYMSIRA